MWPRPNLGNLIFRIPLVMLAIIFVAETAIMTAFAVVSREHPNRWVEVIVDSTVLTLTVAPLLYWLIVRPLRVLADERSRLLAHVFEIQDAERQKIARDLHDEIGQSFTSLLVHLRVLEESPSLDDARRQAHDIRTLSGTLYDQIRTLARGLHPTVLDDLGLVAAVQRLVEDFEATHDTVVAVQLTGNFTSRLPPKLEKAAYRIVQESLTNCAKYAQASHIDIALARDEKQFKVSIADNGQGFDARKIASETTAATFGLANMRERALLLNGSLTIRSRPSAGATVTAQFPLKTP